MSIPNQIPFRVCGQCQSVLRWHLRLTTASYGGEAILFSCWVSVGNEVCRILPDIPRSWLLFVSEHLRSFNSLWRFLRIASNVTRNIIGWSYCFSVPSYCLSRSVLQKTINISQSFQDGTWEKKALPCRNVQKGLIGASWKFRGKIFSIKRENFTVWISELFPVDLNFSSSNCDTTKDDKHLKIISQWRLRHVIEKKKKRLFPCRNI